MQPAFGGLIGGPTAAFVPIGRAQPTSWRMPLVLIGLVLGSAVGLTVWARRWGYGLGGDTTVRCQAGHLFTTLWVPGVSFKASRLGWYRFQRCPVGHHWSLVSPVRQDDLTARNEPRRRRTATARSPEAGRRRHPTDQMTATGPLPVRTISRSASAQARMPPSMLWAAMPAARKAATA